MNPLCPGDRLDHYRLDAEVGHGGMSTIYRATDLADGAPVAIKIPSLELESDPVFYERFRREEATVAKLAHAGVPRIRRDGDRSRLYLVTDWVEGELLRDLLRREAPLAEERATRLAIAIAGILEYIHAHGIIHRDLKPENLLIGAGDRPVLIDFGLAGSAGARRLTFGKLSQLMGTPDYISPEQVRGRRGDARSDLFALGAIYYEMLVGRPPFQGPNAFAIMNDRLLNYPPPPREINPRISEQAQEIVYRALERDPARRYAGAREMIWDLEHKEAVGVAERDELRSWRRRRNPERRRRWLYAGLALLPVLLFWLLFWLARK